MARFTCCLMALVFGCALMILRPGEPVAQIINSVGKVLPPDAAPPDRQIFRYLLREPTSLDISIVTYNADGTQFLFERLVMLDENNDMVPGAAQRREDMDVSSPPRRPVERWSAHDRSRLGLHVPSTS